MHQRSPPLNESVSHERKRSYPGLAPINTAPPQPTSRRPSDMQSPPITSSGGGQPIYNNSTLGSNRLAAATAANAAFPNRRNPLPSPGLPPQPSSMPMGPPPDKEPKSKSSKMKLFSKPKNITLHKDKDVRPPMPSPAKSSTSALREAFANRDAFANASSTSLVDPNQSTATSLYSAVNASTSTLVPTITEKDKDKHRHHFLSRQKHKLKDEHSQLPLSSAASNSQATNPDKQPLYSFAPDSPGPNAFSKSVSGFDLRHGGRALREKKKEEKAAAAQARLDLTPIVSNSSLNLVSTHSDHPNSYDNLAGPPSATTTNTFGFPSETVPAGTAQAFSNIGASMGLAGIGLDDAWPLLKAKLLNLFSGEEVRTPIEELNVLVSVHIRRCIQRRSPVLLLEDVRELLQTGFSSLAQTLRGVPDDRLVTKLVEIWSTVYGAIVPFLQAVFLPLDLEFRGSGTIMSNREAQEFWGAMPENLKSDDRPSSAGGPVNFAALGEELEIRRMTLIYFRDVVLLPKHEALMAIFSRLSLDSINASASPNTTTTQPSGRDPARSDPATTGAERPGTAGSISPHLSSFNSQGSTLMDVASNSSGGGGGLSLASRSRATSNTSAGSFGTSLPHLAYPPQQPSAFTPLSPPLPVIDPAKITETVASMLQCLYVLASTQTGDSGQGVVERLTKALKHNWLGRGRTGRDRRGFVGMKPRVPGQQRLGLVGA